MNINQKVIILFSKDERIRAVIVDTIDIGVNGRPEGAATRMKNHSLRKESIDWWYRFWIGVCLEDAERHESAVRRHMMHGIRRSEAASALRQGLLFWEEIVPGLFRRQC